MTQTYLKDAALKSLGPAAKRIRASAHLLRKARAASEE
jgi:hypothetical protein